jgi:hypothetical protein
MMLTFFFLAILLIAAECQDKRPKRPNKMKGRDPLERSSVLLLDGATFTKVVPHHNLTTVVMIAGRADEGDYGVISMKEDYWAFAEQAEFGGNADYVRFAHMFVEKPSSHELPTASETRDAVAKIDPTFLSSRQHPRIYLFEPNTLEPIMYPQFQSINVIALARWLSQRSKFYMGVPGTIQAFYWLARKFVVDAKLADDEDQFRSDVLAEAGETLEALMREVSSEEYTELGKYYLKTMERVVERGDDYIIEEVSRLEELVSGGGPNLSQEKRQNLQKRVNILHNFITFPKIMPNDEL